MTELKPYRKDKEGKLQRLPVKHVDQYNVHNEEELLTIKPKTHVIVHHGALDEWPLDPRCGLKRACMKKNPFLEAMEKKWKRENAVKND